jgi:hypothetical protein
LFSYIIEINLINKNYEITEGFKTAFTTVYHIQSLIATVPGESYVVLLLIIILGIIQKPIQRLYFTTERIIVLFVHHIAHICQGTRRSCCGATPSARLVGFHTVTFIGVMS